MLDRRSPLFPAMHAPADDITDRVKTWPHFPKDFALLLSSLRFTEWNSDHTILATRRGRLATGSLIDLT